MPNSKQSEPNIRQEPFRRLADWIRQQLHDLGPQRDRRLAHAEELVDEGDEHHEREPDDPGADRRDGQAGVIVRVDDGADLGVGTVGGEQRDLDLSLGDLAGVGVWVGQDIVIGEEGFEAFEGAGGEVWVEVVLGDESFRGLGCV